MKDKKHTMQLTYFQLQLIISFTLLGLLSCGCWAAYIIINRSDDECRRYACNDEYMAVSISLTILFSIITYVVFVRAKIAAENERLIG